MKAKPTRPPTHFTVRDNVPPGAQVVLKPELVKEIVRMFGEKVLRLEAEARDRAPG